MNRHTEEITNSEDIIDSRTVNDRIDYLESLDADEIELEEVEELQKLTALRDECLGNTSEWQYGATLIRDSYFDGEFAETEAIDLGLVAREALDSWPLTQIDWDKAADDLKEDYCEIDFDGVSYWLR